MAEEKKRFLLNIRGDDPLRAHSPLYSNFVSISRLGSDVQLEFIFVDLSQMALLVENVKRSAVSGPQEMVGKTVAKIIMPGVNFLQIKEHLNTIFQALGEELHLLEVGDELSSDAR